MEICRGSDRRDSRLARRQGGRGEELLESKKDYARGTAHIYANEVAMVQALATLDRGQGCVLHSIWRWKDERKRVQSLTRAVQLLARSLPQEHRREWTPSAIAGDRPWRLAYPDEDSEPSRPAPFVEWAKDVRRQAREKYVDPFHLHREALLRPPVEEAWVLTPLWPTTPRAVSSTRR